MVDEQRRRSEVDRAKGAVGAMALALLAACQVTGFAPDDRTVLPAWRDALQPQHTARFVSVPGEGEIGVLDPSRTLFIVDPNWRVPEQSWAIGQRAALHTFVAAGGRLVLFGHAAHLVSELEIEPELPECSVYRWGFDHRALQGRAELMLSVVSGRAPELFEGLQAALQPASGAPAGETRRQLSLDEHSFALTGGRPATLPLCGWQIGAPQNGEVLARLGEVRDGRPSALGPPVLLRWQFGKGEVVACGILPNLEHDDDALRGNAITFVQSCASYCQGPLLVWCVADRSPPGHATRGASDGPPMAPWLAHWGWQVGLYDGDERDSVRPPEELIDAALVPSWLHGADIVELGLTDAQHGAPVAWSARDPIERPMSYRGNGLAGAWGADGFRQLADEAHTRGLLLFAGLDPLPVGDRATERLVVLRMLARELASLRRLGAGAFDGFGLRQWWPDQRGFGLSMVQDYQPAATVYCAGERVPRLAGSLRALDADDGAPRGLSLAGIGAGWRDGFPADLFPLGVLDARVLGDRSSANGVRGGGSRGDWLVRQMNDFVRTRRMAGGTVLWRRHDPRTLGPDTAAYVLGLGLEPLRAAVAMPLAATGRDGIRAAAAQLLADVPAGFGGEVDAPAAVHVLQNNWFRLLGSGGALSFDARGLGRFDAPAEIISPAFMQTRLFGGRPEAAALRSERLDFLAAGHRGEGAYGRVARVGIGAAAEDRVPALLAFDQAPRWPSAVAFDWRPTPGYHELVVRLRSRRGSSLVAISLDGVLLRCLPCHDVGRVAEAIVPVHIADPRTRVLQIEVLDGHAVAIDHLRVQRRGDVGVEAEVTVPAGSCAQLVESSHSSYHEERVTLTALADSPAFVLQASCRRAARNLQIQRRLRLPAYRTIAATTDGDDARARRLPFVLTADQPGLPDVCVVPLQLSRYEHLVVGDGEIVWHSAPQSGLTGRIGFWFCPHGEGAALLPHLPRMLDAIDRPQPVDLGADGRASLVTDMTVPWNRLLHVDGDAQTPFLVREGGYWTWRGSQPAPLGGAWLRVHHAPGDVVEVVGGPVVLARTRPGPGSLRIVAMRDPGPRSVTVHVLQPSRLAAPCIVMAADFDEVLVDGRPWSWFDGRTVFLPDQPSVYRIETNSHGGSAAPHVRCTGAPLTQCRYDPERRELVLVAVGGGQRPAELPWTAVLTGPLPAHIDNGELVDPATLHLADASAAAAAQRGGVLIRFRSGITTIKYGPTGQRGHGDGTQ